MSDDILRDENGNPIELELKRDELRGEIIAMFVNDYNFLNFEFNSLIGGCPLLLSEILESYNRYYNQKLSMFDGIKNKKELFQLFKEIISQLVLDGFLKCLSNYDDVKFYFYGNQMISLFFKERQKNETWGEYSKSWLNPKNNNERFKRLEKKRKTKDYKYLDIELYIEGGTKLLCLAYFPEVYRLLLGKYVLTEKQFHNSLHDFVEKKRFKKKYNNLLNSDKNIQLLEKSRLKILGFPRKEFNNRFYNHEGHGKEGFYSCKEWGTRKAEIMIRANHLCEYKFEGCTKYATLVHHITSSFITEICLDPYNLMTSCKSCHNKRHGNGGYRG